MREYIIHRSPRDSVLTVPSPTCTAHEATAALVELVYRSVVFGVTKDLVMKSSRRDTSEQTQESATVLAVELLLAFNYDLGRLNFFLSKLSNVDMDTLWKILPSL